MKKAIPLTDKELESYFNNKNCYICQKSMRTSMRKKLLKIKIKDQSSRSLSLS